MASAILKIIAELCSFIFPLIIKYAINKQRWENVQTKIMSWLVERQKNIIRKGIQLGKEIQLQREDIIKFSNADNEELRKGEYILYYKKKNGTVVEEKHKSIEEAVEAARAYYYLNIGSMYRVYAKDSYELLLDTKTIIDSITNQKQI